MILLASISKASSRTAAGAAPASTARAAAPLSAIAAEYRTGASQKRSASQASYILRRFRFSTAATYSVGSSIEGNFGGAGGTAGATAGAAACALVDAVGM